MSRMKIIALVVCLWAVHSVKCEMIKKKVGMFVFGDSLYDPGNVNNLNISTLDKANYWPYGVTFFNFSTGRFCDGRNIPDFIASSVNLPLWKPYMDANGTQNFSHGANFAAGGAGVLSDTNPGTISLRMQLSYFKRVATQLREEVGEEEANQILKGSVYLSSIGGDDYPRFYADNVNATETEIQGCVKLVIANLSQVIKEMYDMGGRKFAFQNVAPLGCLPWIRLVYGDGGDKCVEGVQVYARLHNKLLMEEVEALASQLDGFQYSMFDYYSSLYHIITDPSHFGFKVADYACCRGETHCGMEPYQMCSNRSEYVFFDDGHPTEATNQLLFNLVWNSNSTFTTPYNFQQLFDLQISSTDVPTIESYHEFGSREIV